MTITEALDVRQATLADLPYIMTLMRRNRESVGGLPEPAIRERLERGTVMLASINADPVGYLLYDIRSRHLRIPQACIQYDARRRRYGEALMAALMQRHGSDVDEVTLRCAADLEANVFWRDMGFTCVGNTRGGSRRGRLINAWAMWLTPKLVTLAEVARLPARQGRVDTMYDDSAFAIGERDGFAPSTTLPKLAWANRDRPKQLTLGVDE